MHCGNINEVCNSTVYKSVFCRTPYCEAHNCAGAAGTSGVLVWSCACMYVCMYVRNEFAIEIYGLRIVYILLQHVPLMMPSRWRSRTRRMLLEDSAVILLSIILCLLLSCMETVNCSTKDKRMKDNKITATRNDLCVSTRAIYFGDPWMGYW